MTNNIRRSNRKILGLATLVASGALPSVMAEELVLEEVLVTAQKQEQRLQDAPVTVNAISADTYNDTASFDLKDIERLTAGIDISGDSFNQDFQVRGIGTNLDSGTSARVTLYKDGAYVNQQRAIFLSQFDLEQFELLRGPQGTLYGKASPAGSLVVHTKDPSLTKYDGYAKVSVFSRDGSNTQFGASIPIIEDELGIRIGGVFDKNSNDDIHNETRGDDNITRTKGGRITLKWLATEKLDTRLSYNHTELKTDNYEVSTNSTYDEEDRRAFGNADSFLHIRDEHAIGEVNYAISEEINLTSVTFYQELLTRRFIDNDLGASPFVDATQFVESDIGKIWNTELRLHNTTSDKWDWITGIYYSKSEAKTPVEAITNFVVPFPGTNTFSLTSFNITEDLALFHHSGIRLNHADKLTIGFRFNDVSTNARTPFSDLTTTAGGFPLVFRSGEAIPLDVEKREFQEFTGTIKFQHDFNEKTTGYISWDRGWRNASSTVDATGAVPPELILHDDEPSINYEFGLKGQYWEGRGRYNAAAYWQTYQDFQFQADGIPVDQDGDGMRDATFNAVVNADKVITSGVEVESTVLLSADWTAFASLSYNDTEFDKFDDAPCNRGTMVPTNSYNTCDFSGQRVSDAPNVSAIASSEYRVPMESWGAEWYASALVKYESFRRDIATGQRLDEYTVVDLFTGLRHSSGRWDINAWVKNVTDETVIEVINVNTFGAPGLNVNNPLTAGLTGTWRWGIE